MTEWLLAIKRCRCCNCVKWRSDFPSSKTNRDGKNSWCRACYNEKSKARYQREGVKEQKRAYDKAYHLENKDWIRVRTREYVRARVADGWVNTWSKDNPEARRAIAATYKAKRRAQCKDGMSGRELRLWLEIQDLICVWCGIECGDKYHIDHVNPLAKGGRHEWTNLAIACPSCNFRKSSRDPMEFALEMKAKLAA